MSDLRASSLLPNLDAWWQEVSRRQLPQKYLTLRIRPPTEFPWGREVHIVDLAGVCWHVGQVPGSGQEGLIHGTPAPRR
jgi:hypothetical protein